MNYWDKTSGHCLAASHFVAYKCAIAGILSTQATLNLQFSSMIFIDNQNSAAPVIGSEGDALSIMMWDMFFYGENLARDCDS